MVRKKKYFGKRAMLNLPGNQGTAAIVAEIEDTSTWLVGKDGRGHKLGNKWSCLSNDIKLCVSDCSRTVELSIDIGSEKGYVNSIHKVDTMIEALSGLRMGLVTERARYLERSEGLEGDTEE